jgi:hypothetical protein
MEIGLAAVYRTPDGSEVCFVRSVGMPAVPAVGSSLSVGGVFMSVTHVHFYADDTTYVAGVNVELTLQAPLPRTRAEFIEAASNFFPGWKVVPPPPHLRLVK